MARYRFTLDWPKMIRGAKASTCIDRQLGPHMGVLMALSYGRKIIKPSAMVCLDVFLIRESEALGSGLIALPRASASANSGLNLYHLQLPGLAFC